MLDGMVVAAVALIAGADGATAGRLAVAMVGIQVSIGALNDLIDAGADAGHKPGKPIPAGLVAPDAARAMVVAGAAVGLGLSVLSGPGLVALAGVCLAIGYAYDLWAKGTPWSWLPFAVGIPLLPVFGWWGAAGSLPAMFAILLPAAVLAGAALAIANARVDLERDLATGRRSIATALGTARAWGIHAALLGSVIGASILTLVASGVPRTWVVATALAGLVVLVGVALGRTGSPARRERAWELEAIGLALLAATWLVGLAGEG